VLAIQRDGRKIDKELKAELLKVGDVLIVLGPTAKIMTL
jgi:uncharacterized protein with PhoU and TrkA domain